MVTCLRMPEKRSDGIWVTECCRVAWEGSVWLHLLSLLLFLWRGKQLLFIQLLFDPSAGLIVTDSLTRGLYSTVFCPEYWPHTNPLPCFGFCCLSWERVSFLGLADLDSVWTRLASNLEQSAPQPFQCWDYRYAPPHLASSLFWEHFRLSFWVRRVTECLRSLG